MCADVQTNSDTIVTQVCYNDVAMAGSSTGAENPWASPSQEPVNGIVQPRVVPPIGKPTRHTNQLDYLFKTVLKDVMKHKHAWPFLTPVDAVKLNLPDYHKVIRRPMDLKTVKVRLKNNYYYSAKDCMEDIECVFRNCYKFNQMEDDVAIMCQNIENVYRNLIRDLPEEEVEIARPHSKPGTKCVPKRFHSVSKAGSISEAHAPSVKKEIRRISFAQSSGNVERCSTETAVKASTGRPVKRRRGIKRRADTTTGVLIKGKFRKGHERKIFCPATKSSQAKGNLLRNYESSDYEEMKFCREVLKELMGKECKDFNWPFLAPVDVEGLKLSDYNDIISNPMDLGTIKKKLNEEKYATAQEFAEDIRLVCSNCFKYNPASSIIHQHGRALLQAFNERWLNLPVDDKLVHVVASSSGAAIDNVENHPVRVELSEEKLSKITKGITSHLLTIKQLVGQTALQDIILREIESIEKVVNELCLLTGPQNKQVYTKAHKSSTATSADKDLVSSSPETKLTTPMDAYSEAQPCCSYGRQQTKSNISTNKKHWKESYRFDSGDEATHKPMSFDEKRQLSLDMGKLPADKLNVLVSIIESREGIYDEKAEEVEIDFEALQPVTLHELRAFVTAVLKRKSCKSKFITDGWAHVASPATKSENEERERVLGEEINSLGGALTQISQKGSPTVDVALQDSKCAPSLSESSPDSEDSSSTSDDSSDSNSS